MGGPLKTLKESNLEQTTLWEILNGDKYERNGIACPDCGAELMDDLSVVLASIPPQLNIFCTDCTYKGYRVK